MIGKNILFTFRFDSLLHFLTSIIAPDLAAILTYRKLTKWLINKKLTISIISFVYFHLHLCLLIVFQCVLIFKHFNF